MKNNNNIFLKNYQKIEIIGKGTYAKVYKVKNKINNKIFALKQIELYSYKKYEITKSLNEVNLLSTLKHDNIIGFYNSYFDKNKNTLYILLEYLEGGDMFDMIKKMKNRKIYLPEGRILNYIYQIILGIEHIHTKNIIHRDIKLANIFLTKDKSKIKIGDFNVSKDISQIHASTQTGTPYYCSPEIWLKQKHSFGTDIWSLGCLIYEICNFKPPFYGENQEILKNKVCLGKIENWNTMYSNNLFNFVKICLNTNQHKRPNINELMNHKIFDKLKNELNESKRRKLKNSYEFQIKTSTNFLKKNLNETNKNQKYKSQINSSKNIFTKKINTKVNKPLTQIKVEQRKIKIINDFKITPLKKNRNLIKKSNKKNLFENINEKINKISKTKLLNYNKNINKNYNNKYKSQNYYNKYKPENNFIKNKIIKKKYIRPFSNINKKKEFKIVKRVTTANIYFRKQKNLENKIFNK